MKKTWGGGWPARNRDQASSNSSAEEDKIVRGWTQKKSVRDSVSARMGMVMVHMVK